MKTTAFTMERLRSVLAKTGQYEQLVKTYSPDYPEIADANSPEFWDCLNENKEDYTKQTSPMAAQRVRTLARAISRKNSKVLNVGFGSASLEEEYFRSSGTSVVWHGLEISRRSVLAARKKFRACTFSLGDIKRIPAKDNSYDYVIASEVLEHIQPRFTFVALNELYRVLKPDGTLLLSVPLYEGLESMIGKGKNPNAHVRIYTPELLQAELLLAGMTVTKVHLFYAFHTYYNLKSFLAKYILINFRDPNNLLVFAKKKNEHIISYKKILSRHRWG